jgi:hypothetical protein
MPAMLFIGCNSIHSQGFRGLGGKKRKYLPRRVLLGKWRGCRIDISIVLLGFETLGDLGKFVVLSKSFLEIRILLDLFSEFLFLRT